MTLRPIALVFGTSVVIRWSGMIGDHMPAAPLPARMRDGPASASERARIRLTVISDDAALTGLLESVLQADFSIITLSSEGVKPVEAAPAPEVVLLDVSPGWMSA